MTLGGHVATEGDKSHAESIARSLAEAQLVSNQIVVIPPCAETEAQQKLHESVKYAVKNHAVTPSGDVDPQAKRARAEEIASAVVNVQQEAKGDRVELKEQA